MNTKWWRFRVLTSLLKVVIFPFIFLIAYFVGKTESKILCLVIIKLCPISIVLRLTLNIIDIANSVNPLNINPITTNEEKSPKLRVTWTNVLHENKRNIILSPSMYTGKKHIFKRKRTKYDVLDNDIWFESLKLGLTFLNIFLLPKPEKFCEAQTKQRWIWT